MLPESGLVALLHVSAVVGALTAAYVGFDHSSGGRIPNEDAYKDAEEIARNLVLQLGLNSENSKTAMSSKKWGRVRIIYPTKVICIVGTMPLKLGWFHTVIHCFYRQWHIPFFKYFRWRIDYLVATGIAVTSIAIFFLSAATLIWQIDWSDGLRNMHCAFYFLVLSTVWLVIQGALSLLANEKRITKKCSKLDSVVKARLEKVWTEAEETLREFKPNGTSGP